MKQSVFLAFSFFTLHFSRSRALLYSPAPSLAPVFHMLRPRQVDAEASPPISDTASTPTLKQWATHALLFSSWTDGVTANPNARSFLKYGISRKMLSDKRSRQENVVEASVEFSPCNGPNIDALNNLELIDKLVERGRGLIKKEGGLVEDGEELNSWSNEVLQYLIGGKNDKLDLRFLYIPTAMYALNPQSSNTPGEIYVSE
jgi:hypothetical protein